MIGIRKHGKLHFRKVALKPSFVGVLAVRRRTDDLAVGLIELLFQLGKTTDFSWANKCKIKRIEEQADPLAFVVLQRNIFENKNLKKL